MFKEEKKKQLGQSVEKYHIAVQFLVIVAIFSIIEPVFLSAVNLKNIILQNTYMFMVLSGITFIMVGGGIDLSVGYQISLITVVMGLCFNAGLKTPVVIVAGLLTGILCGTLNGVLISVLKIVPYVATIMTQLIFKGVSYMLSEGKAYSDIPASFRVISHTEVYGISVDMVIAVCVLVLVEFIFKRTFFGRQVKAMGENAEITERAGVNVQRNRLLCYMISGAMYSVAAMILLSKQGIATSTTGVGVELIAIASFLIGGTGITSGSAWSGDFQIVNLILGELTCAVLENGIQLIGGNVYIQNICIGIIVVCSFMYRRIELQRGEKSK